MAFVVVTHQHPEHTSLLPELLRRCAAMPVVEASDNLYVKQNCIYVARPEGYLAMVNGKLQFMDCLDSSAVRLPIDYFFRSLAEDQRERAVGIILSGTASDGTLGVEAIIRQVLQGKTYVSENMSGKVLEIFSGRRRRADDTTIGKLTDREFEVFRLLGQGMTTREIGQQLRLGTKTVETHRLHVREKLGLKSGPALIKYAVRWAGTQELI